MYVTLKLSEKVSLFFHSESLRDLFDSVTAPQGTADIVL